jgi:hypothetical protein
MQCYTEQFLYVTKEFSNHQSVIEEVDRPVSWSAAALNEDLHQMREGQFNKEVDK